SWNGQHLRSFPTRRSSDLATVFIVVHALYKGGLFLITGVIDHQTGTRDLTKLRGLRYSMPILAIAGLLAALSSAGIPLTVGFIRSEEHTSELQSREKLVCR